MTQEDILRLAKEAGWREVFEGDGWHIQTDIVECFAKLVAEATREHSAQMLSEEGWLMAATLVRVKK